MGKNHFVVIMKSICIGCIYNLYVDAVVLLARYALTVHTGHKTYAK